MKPFPASQIALILAAVVATLLIWDRWQDKLERERFPSSTSLFRTVAAQPVTNAQGRSSAGSAALSCYDHARKKTLLGEGNAFLLCRGASSEAPVRCYERGQKKTLLAQRQLFDLCRCATSPGPIECFERGHRETFLEDRKIVELCSPVVTEKLWPNCTPITGTPQPFQ